MMNAARSPGNGLHNEQRFGLTLHNGLLDFSSRRTDICRNFSNCRMYQQFAF